MIKRAGFVLQGFVVALATFAIAIGGCDTPTPTAVPTVTRAIGPLTVSLTVNPDIEDVLAEQAVALTVDASGQDLRFKWSVARGRLSATNAPAVIYTAPSTAGVDTVTVEVTSAAGKTIKSKSFNVKVPPTPTPAPTITLKTPLDKAVCPVGEPCTFAVSGVSAGIAPSMKVVVFLNPDPGQVDHWFPHPIGPVRNDGTWQGQARIGDQPCWPAGDDFQIVALALTADQASKIATTFQALPQEYAAKSDVVNLVTAYNPLRIDLAHTSASPDQGATASISAQANSLVVDYDLGTGEWVMAIVRLTPDLDLSCLRKLGASLSFSFEGTGNVNSVEVKLEDADGTNYGWLSPGGSVGSRTIKLPLDKLEYWWDTDTKDPDMNWQRVRNIILAVSKKESGAGGKGRIVVKDVSIAP